MISGRTGSDRRGWRWKRPNVASWCRILLAQPSTHARACPRAGSPICLRRGLDAVSSSHAACAFLAVGPFDVMSVFPLIEVYKPMRAIHCNEPLPRHVVPRSASEPAHQCPARGTGLGPLRASSGTSPWHGHTATSSAPANPSRAPLPVIPTHVEGFQHGAHGHTVVPGLAAG